MKSKIAESSILKIDITSFFSAEGGPIWIKFCRLVQNDIVDCGDMVKIKTRCRIPIWRTFGRIPWHVIREPPATGQIQRHVIPKPRITFQGAATWWIQRHVIPESRITLQGAATWWIHCHDSRATCHIAGCSHLAKSMSWSCHIAGCKNSIRHIENCFFVIFYLFFLFFKNAALALMSDGFHIVCDELVLKLL